MGFSEDVEHARYLIEETSRLLEPGKPSDAELLVTFLEQSIFILDNARLVLEEARTKAIGGDELGYLAVLTNRLRSVYGLVVARLEEATDRARAGGGNNARARRLS